MRKVYLLPNLFTTASLFCGVLAILNVFNVANVANVAESDEINKGLYEISCWLILLSAVLDLFDGWVARMTHTESQFGVQYDSLSDAVAFGVAPAVLIYTRLANMENRHAAEVITTLYAVCGVLRLARFNVQKSRVEKKSFTGLPIPAAAGTVVSGFLFFQRVDPDWNKEFVLRILPVIMVGLSYLMVSTISYPSFKQLELEGKKRFEVLPLIVVIAIVGFVLKNHIDAVVFLGFVGYVSWGIVAEIVRFVSRRKSTASSPEPTGQD